ncbi:MAG: thymidylate synthase [Methanotrichaceae archaeon]|nr:thymidylate synthase [Methanotrichaceae archaeon]
MIRLGRLIRATTICDAWHRGINLIWRQGQQITDQRGTKIKELLSLQVVVENPYSDMIPQEYSWNQERLEDYANQLLSSENPGFEYTYGNRLRAWDFGCIPLDQIDHLIKLIKDSPSTRRATAVTWIPPIDSTKDEVPCMIVIDFKIRDERMNLTAFFRSHDFAGAYPANLYGLARILEFVSKDVSVSPGSISTLSASAHIYEHDWDWVREMLLGSMRSDI